MTSKVMAEKILERWGFHSLDDRSAQAPVLLAISLGLGSLFDENTDAERTWIGSFHPALQARPIDLILDGLDGDVLELVNKERGLD